jgi:hypothetical protein
MGEPEAWDLVFSRAVKGNVGLLEAMGFRLTDENHGRVCYQSPAGVFVYFLRDSSDRYVGFRVGLSDDPKDALTETEILALAG